MNIQEIEESIRELEDGDTTFNNCQKLASLYIVKENYKSGSTTMVTDVIEELQDIIPQYRIYKEIKRQYQLRECPKEKVLHSMQFVCQEIKEFLQTLYSSSDMEEERILLTTMLSNLIF